MLGRLLDLASTAREYHKKVEADALADMCTKLSNLKITNPSVMNMLKNTGLDVVAEAAQTLHNTACSMLEQWLHLEEVGMIDDDDEEEENDGLEANEQPTDKLHILNQLLPLLKDVHEIEAKLNDDTIMNAAIELIN